MRVICPHCKNVNNIPIKESYKVANCGECKNSLLDTTPIDLCETNFDEVLVNSDIPVIIDFWAPWCGPCKMMGPNFEKSAKKFALKALYVKVNTEEEQNLEARFKIKSIPTLLVFKNGIEIHRMSGLMDEITLNNLASQFI
ncbi:thioredoxin TrxC [Sulfurimonas sp.]|uniref:thioredoxin TrxC n=1 Tax=Sulfurimonas sp. TaxID=2022749 RepID=UPI0025E85F81|nr:thioredoxin TrxC [Sulfurimonas sp.]